jgi:hypothetical protein
MADKGDNSAAGGGLGFSGALTILFVGLKLGGVIAWSWWWVLSPIWITAALVLLFLGVVIVVGALLS